MSKHKIVIVGGGTGGITVAARLLRADKKLDVAVIEPSSKHYYQPAWTLVGAGTFDKLKTQREEASVMPSGAHWIRDAVSEFMPDDNTLSTRDGQTIEYDFLIVAAGIQIDWERIKGLKQAVGHDGVCSNYSFEYVDSTWEEIRNFKGGNAIFTMPNTAIYWSGMLKGRL